MGTFLKYLTAAVAGFSSAAAHPAMAGDKVSSVLSGAAGALVAIISLRANGRSQQP